MKSLWKRIRIDGLVLVVLLSLLAGCNPSSETETNTTDETTTDNSNSDDDSNTGSNGDEQQQTRQISGFVYNGRIASATVVIDDDSLLQTTTTADGSFSLEAPDTTASYRVKSTGGQLNGVAYVGELVALCSDNPCYVTPYSTVLEALVRLHGFNTGDASAHLASLMQFDGDPFARDLQDIPVHADDWDMTGARNAIANGTGLQQWVTDMVEWIMQPGSTAPAGPMAVTAETRGKVRVGVHAPYPPFVFHAPDGELTGFEIQLGNEVCQIVSGNDCEWVVQAWDGIIPGLLTRKYDMIFSIRSINSVVQRRLQSRGVLFSEPYYTTPSAFFAPDGNGFDPDNSAGKRVGAQHATIQDTYITEFLTGAEIVLYTTVDDIIVDLQGGGLDAMFIDAPVGIEMLEGNDGVAQVGDFIKEPTRIFGEGVGAALLDSALEEQVSAALEQLKNDGTYDTIMQKYFDIDIKL